MFSERFASSRAVAPITTAINRPGPCTPFTITWPIFSEHLLQASVGLLFVWLTSRISDGTAAAFGLSNQLMVTFVILFRLVGVGASVVVTQYLGAGDRAGAQRIARASLGGAVWLGSVVAPKEIEFVSALPHTSSGKIMRRLLKAREMGLPEGDISTLEPTK